MPNIKKDMDADNTKENKLAGMAVNDVFAKYILEKNPELYHEIVQNFMRETG